MEKIYNANDKAIEERGLDPRATYTSHRERMGFDFNQFISRAMRSRHIPVWNGVMGYEHPIHAFVSRGRWLAQCPCGNVEYVSGDDPTSFCHECGNKDVNGSSRPVIFPAESKTIEAELLERTVETDPSAESYSDIQKSVVAKAVDQPRDWYPENYAAIIAEERALYIPPPIIEVIEEVP